MEAQLEYGNWIRRRNLIILGVCTLVTGALLLVPLRSIYHLLITVLFVSLLVSFLIPLYAYWMFSQKGGRLQEKIYNLIIREMGEAIQGRILDIGSGNGVLAVKLARQYGEVDVTGMDYWGQDWEYSKSVCEKNARIGGVDHRVHFQKGDAARLDFASDTFDGAISNLTFHEVKTADNPKAVLREALRVVKPGGTFVFVDYFYDEKYYGSKTDFEKFLKELHLTHFECQPIQDLVPVSALMKHPKILGKVGMICGKK